jgi:hypothetical protein
MPTTVHMVHRRAVPLCHMCWSCSPSLKHLNAASLQCKGIVKVGTYAKPFLMPQPPSSGPLSSTCEDAALNADGGSSSRVSTAGSTGTIGWAGPWISTHRRGGVDRMYPAHLRYGQPHASKSSPSSQAHGMQHTSACQWNFRTDVALVSARRGGIPPLPGTSARLPQRGQLPSELADTCQACKHGRTGNANCWVPPEKNGTTGSKVNRHDSHRAETPIERLKNRQGLWRMATRQDAESIANEATRNIVDGHLTVPRAEEQKPKQQELLQASPELKAPPPKVHKQVGSASQPGPKSPLEPSLPQAAVRPWKTPKHKAEPQQANKQREELQGGRDAHYQAATYTQGEGSGKTASHDATPAVGLGASKSFDAMVAAAQVDADGGAGDNRSVLLRCDGCGRSFNRSAYKKHHAVCKKVFVQKRASFNIKQTRAADGAAEAARGASHTVMKQKQTVRRGASRWEERPILVTKKSSWKQRSEMFRAAIRANRYEMCLCMCACACDFHLCGRIAMGHWCVRLPASKIMMSCLAFTACSVTEGVQKEGGWQGRGDLSQIVSEEQYSQVSQFQREQCLGHLWLSS